MILKYCLARIGWQACLLSFVCMLAGVLALGLSGCEARPKLVQQTLSGPTMGTRYSITLVPWPGMPAMELVGERVSQELNEVNLQMSTYIPDSELSRFNDSSSLDWFEVSPQTAQVVQLALDLNQTCLGAFDVTVGPLVDLWGFGPGGREDSLPTQDAIDHALRAIGSDKLQVRSDPPAIKKAHADLRIDLSAIAKGHGVDRVAQVLDELQFANYFIEIGGEVRTRGLRLDGGPWRIGIEKPTENERALQTVVQLRDLSLATSGDYRNYFDLAGKRYSHCIDPRTGQPTTSDVASASVIAKDCATADALATGLMALGSEQGMALAERNNWAVMLIARKQGEFLIKSSAGFEQLVLSPVDPQTALTSE